MKNVNTGPRFSLRRAIPFALLALLTVASGAAVLASIGSGIATQPGPEGVVIFDVPTLGSASTSATGAIVDGVRCETQKSESVKYHIHTYVSVFVNGRQERLPAGIGITRPALVEHYPTGVFYDVGLFNCLYWIHTHAADGIVHVESPAKGRFTLGQLFDIWRQPLSAHQVGTATGHVVVFENGQRWTGSARSAPLSEHGVVQIDVGSSMTPFHPFSFKVTGACGQGTTSCALKTKG